MNTKGICKVCGKEIDYKKDRGRIHITDLCSNKCRHIDWYQNNRERILRSRKENYESNSEYRIKYAREYKKTNQEKARKIFGDKCFICHKKARQKKAALPDFHRIDGEEHKGLAYVDAIKNPDKYVPLCPLCHRGVHFAMEKLGMTWKEIQNMLKEVVI